MCRAQTHRPRGILGGYLPDEQATMNFHPERDRRATPLRIFQVACWSSRKAFCCFVVALSRIGWVAEGLSFLLAW